MFPRSMFSGSYFSPSYFPGPMLAQAAFLVNFITVLEFDVNFVG